MKEYKVLEINTTAVTIPKLNIVDLQEGLNKYAKEGWSVDHITPLANINGITGKIIITLSKEVLLWLEEDC